MFNFVRAPLSLLALTLTLLISWQAQAAIVSLDFGTVYSGDVPAGTIPWINATFSDYATDQVLLTLTDKNLQDSEFITDWDFNFNPAKNLSNLQFAWQSGVQPTGITVKLDKINADGAKGFDINLANASANQGNRFGVGSAATILITGIPGLTADDFNFSISAFNMDMLAAAHVQGISLDSLPTGLLTDGLTSSGWIAATTTPSTVPEPATMLLVSLGLGGISLARKRFASGRASR